MLTAAGRQNPTAESVDSWWSAWSALAKEPALLESLLVVAVGGMLLLISLRMARLAREACGRAAVKDYLLGVEQALSGDAAGARQRLERVLAEDPENHHARLLYGEVLAELGETASAHKQHLFLHTAFKVDSTRNHLALARTLLASGRPAESAEAARRAIVGAADDRATLTVLFKAELAAGLPEDAGRTGARLLRLLPDGAERASVRRRAAASLALAGSVRLTAGDAQAARALSAEAAGLDPQSTEVRKLKARLAFHSGGELELSRFLLAETEPIGREPPAGGDALVPLGTLPEVVRRAAPPMAALVPAGSYFCSSCGGVLDAARWVCAHCGAVGKAEASEAGLFTSVDSPSAAMDEIDANRTHVRRQLDALLRGDEAAADDLIEIGDRAVEPLLTAAVRNAETTDVVVGLLRRMGPASLPALFEAYAKLAEQRVRNLLYGGAGAGVMGRVVQGYGRDALPYFQGLLDTRDRDLRKILLDYYIGLGDQQEFEVVLEHFPPVEVIHRLNAAEAAVLMPLLRSAEPGSFFTEGVLTQPFFHRGHELLLAIPGAADPEVLIAVLQQRGYSAQLAEALLDHVADSPAAAAAGRVLDAYGLEALDPMLFAFADFDRPPAVREQLMGRIGAMGPPVVGQVCALLGPTPSSLDEGLIALLTGIGAAAVPPLVEAYRKTSLVEKLGGPLVGRHNHRRTTITRVLATIGARRELQQLREQETDTNLKLRLAQALQSMPADDGAPAESAGRDDREEPHGQAG